MRDFWLGTSMPHWLELTATPLFVASHRLAPYKNLPKARGLWAQDSGGFNQITQHGRYLETAEEYASQTAIRAKQIGHLAWAAPQDWMCEPMALARTGLTIKVHQRKTIVNWLVLNHYAPHIQWVPVLQGWTFEDYFRHVGMYKAVGVDLRDFSLVGVGTICRRQHTVEAEEIITCLADYGLRLHGFGFKVRGLQRVHQQLVSADSMAWSFRARRIGHPVCGGLCTAKKACNNCIFFALQWYAKVKRLVAN